jgi:hypothetical protein
MARFVFGRTDLAEYTKELAARWLDNKDNIDIYKTLLIIRWFNERGRKLALFQDRIVELERENQLLKNDKLNAAAPELLDALQGLLGDIQDYQKINNLGGENNHWQVIARNVIAKATGQDNSDNWSNDI